MYSVMITQAWRRSERRVNSSPIMLLLFRCSSSMVQWRRCMQLCWPKYRDVASAANASASWLLTKMDRRFRVVAHWSTRLEAQLRLDRSRLRYLLVCTLETAGVEVILCRDFD